MSQSSQDFKWHIVWLILPLVTLAFSACTPTTQMQVFWHDGFRKAYAIKDQELRNLQFYISSDVLAKKLTPGGVSDAESVYIVQAATPGIVTEAAPNWIRVSFHEGGRGVPFVAIVDQGGDSSYWLATEIEGEQGFWVVKDLPEKIIRVQGAAYQLMRGDSAKLLVGSRGLEKLVQGRTHIQGRTISK